MFPTRLLLLSVTALLAAATFCSGAAINNVKVYPPRLTDTRIVGGSEVNIAMHPHQISMRFKNIFYPENSFNHRCGGSIYSKNVIITAAHCIIATVPSQYQIVAGTNNRQGSDGAIVRVKEIIMHDDYNPDTFENDIAILIVDPPLPLNKFNIRPIQLAEGVPKAAARATITGWGALTEGGFAANTLQEVHVPVVPNEVCNYDYEGMIRDSMLCAGDRGVGGKDACQGDSGGPLLVDGKLAGIVSWGYGCARPDKPGVYSNVSYLRPWLLEKIAQYEESEENESNA